MVLFLRNEKSNRISFSYFFFVFIKSLPMHSMTNKQSHADEKKWGKEMEK